MTDTAPTRRSVVGSISLPRELSEWVAAEAVKQNIPKSKVIQLAITQYMNAPRVPPAV